MADLTYIEKANIEIFLGMKSGYVMDFSDRTFQEFVGEAVGLDINDSKYHYSSNSKANRLRQFIKVESNYTFGKLLSAFCDYWLSKVHIGEINYHNDENLYKECVKIADRLKQESIVEHIDAIKPNTDDRDFKLLAKSIRESIEKNEPEAALDRLHTFTFKYLRELCDKHKITYDKVDSLNAVFGKYVKFIVDNKHIESSMSEKILKYSINIIEAFNDIRNNKSFAHDNPVLNYHESLLIFNNISSTIKFIEFIETQIKKVNEPEKIQEAWDDLPF
ncbi:abortive infection family protein [Faecalibacter rhinopitheci]|uniref:Abortive infection family protein n=1 Tax=Faecalibacter rhinopitheci TaxID=2779678 RepID=A0A8J7KIS3_9FLAO|nr:abortive infection family protein [Faecalibacter rhinopitheci]MBF0598311.1 abortive infection family protein [Faecalibacter rhinopitheci]